MAEANDSVAVTPGTGATVATQLVNGKEYQVVMMANSRGQLMEDIPTFDVWSGAVAATANMVYMHIFNPAASGRIVKVRKVFVQPSQAVSAFTVGQTWRIAKTSALGTTGAVALTMRPHDSLDTTIGTVTAQRGYTAGGTQTFTWFEVPLDVEETRAAVGIMPYINLLPTEGDFTQDIVLREGEGMAVQNVTGGAYTYSVLAVITIE